MPVKLNARAHSETQGGASSAEPAQYISFEDAGVAYITDTRMTIKQIARESVRCNHSLQDIIDAHPYLSFPQIEAALENYKAHKETIDREMAEDDRFFEARRKEQSETLPIKTLLQRKDAVQ